MNKLFKLFLIISLVGGLFTPAMATNYEYAADAYRKTITTEGELELIKITSGVTFKVLTVNTDTAATITVRNSSTSLTNPVTTTSFAAASACKGQVRFRGTESSFDVIVTDTAGGFTAFVEGFTPYDHKIIIDERPNMMHHGCIPVASSVAETDTGVDFKYDTVIHNVMLEVVTIDASETVDVGLLSSETSGDADGLLAAVSVTTGTEGYYNPLYTTTTAGSNETYISTAATVGVFLGVSVVGTDVNEDTGIQNNWEHVVLGANAVSLTHTGSAGSDTFAGYIHYWFTQTR